ncbi:MAG: hypothetical protein ACO1OQ_14635 [Rufibacter sp.]
MTAVLLPGLQAAGKSAIDQRHFPRARVREVSVSPVLLRYCHRMQKFLEASLQNKAKLIVDTTNPTRPAAVHFYNLGKAVPSGGILLTN